MRSMAERVLSDAGGRTCSSTAGEEPGAHPTAKGAALSQFIIFMRQQHLPISTQQQAPGQAAHGGCEAHTVLWDSGQSWSLQGGMKQGMNGVLGENGNSPLAPRLALLRGVPCSR